MLWLYIYYLLLSACVLSRDVGTVKQHMSETVQKMEHLVDQLLVHFHPPLTNVH